MSTLEVHLVNTSLSNNVYAYVTGHDIDHGEQWMLLQADGRTVYRPSSPASQTPLQTDCAIKLNGPGESRTVRIPHISGGRIYFSVNAKLRFFINPGPALVEPSSTNPGDPNYNVMWGFCELTWNYQQIYANISYVDFVSVPIAIKVYEKSGKQKAVYGMADDGMHRVAEGLWNQSKADDKPWKDLIHRAPNDFDKIIRVLSPNQGMVLNPNLLSGYYDRYVNKVWDHYSSRDMTIDLQGAAGDVRTARGRVSNGQLVLNGQPFGKPSTLDIFGANSGPFTTGGDPVRNAIIPRFNAEFNRSTLLKTTSFPAPVSDYYEEKTTNHYARIVHKVTNRGRGYASPYDDVTPTGGVDQSGFVSSGTPRLFSVYVGGGAYKKSRSRAGVVQALEATSIKAAAAVGVDRETQLEQEIDEADEPDLTRDDDGGDAASASAAATTAATAPAATADGGISGGGGVAPTGAGAGDNAKGDAAVASAENAAGDPPAAAAAPTATAGAAALAPAAMAGPTVSPAEQEAANQRGAGAAAAAATGDATQAEKGEKKKGGLLRRLTKRLKKI